MLLLRPHLLRWILPAAFFLVCVAAEAGLRDIHPRPQQMGLLSSTPAVLAGVPYLVIPSNPSADEVRMRDEAIRQMALRIGQVPQVLVWSEYHGQSPALWLGTLARFPELAAALDSSGIAGVGSTTHEEEYQLVVESERILLGGSDLRGLRWGVQSLMSLMSEVMGRYYVDRAYIRDWPDLAERVGTANTGLRTQSQADWGNRIADASYAARMNEIEWNTGMGAGITRPATITWANAFLNRLKNYGMSLTAGLDNTAKTVSVASWREGVPVRDMAMRVTDSAMVPIATGYPVGIVNSSLETWTNGRPVGYTMYNDSYYAYVARDSVIRHAGLSSARINANPGAPTGLELRQPVFVGREHMMHVKVWYRVAGYKGQLRLRLMGTKTPLNRYEDRWVTFNTVTTQDWTALEFDFRSFDADTVHLFLGTSSSVQGTVWLDDIEFTTGSVQDIVRRVDTPLELYRQRQNLLMTEGIDYRVVELDTTAYPQYVRRPRLERLAGGRLTVGDTVRFNWYCGMAINGSSGKQTPCFSMLEPLVDYQARVAQVDSLLHPDKFKIHINEVSYANYDPLCTRRHLSPGQLVGSYCQQMYNILQARRPGVPVRIYGDAFDIYAEDPRAMPLQEGVPWTTGALQQLSPAVEMMAMTDYSKYIDSTLIYFAANGHASIVANALWESYAVFLRGAEGARRQGAVGYQYYLWEGECSTDLETRVQIHGDLAWNLGPYIIHQPQAEMGRSDSVVIRAEMWTDSFKVNLPVSLTATTLHYRVLPGGSWTARPMTREGTDLYRGAIPGITGSTTSVEYYLQATDHRTQTRTAPADAPQKVFHITFITGGTSTGGDGGEEVPHSLRQTPAATLVQWTADSSVGWYEVHVGNAPDFSVVSRTRLARQRPACSRLLLRAEQVTPETLASLRVYAIRERVHATKSSEKLKMRNQN